MGKIKLKEGKVVTYMKGGESKCDDGQGSSSARDSIGDASRR